MPAQANNGHSVTRFFSVYHCRVNFLRSYNTVTPLLKYDCYIILHTLKIGTPSISKS